MPPPVPPAAPAVLPLPGGAAQGVVKLHPLLCGTFKGPRRWFSGPPGISGALAALGVGLKPDLVEIPIVAFLIEHPQAGLILVDSGLSPSLMTRGASTEFGRLPVLIVFRHLHLNSSQAVRTQLEQRGFDPDEVKWIVMTHLHADHASGLSEFPGTAVLVAKQEWDNIGGPSAGYSPAPLSPALDYRLLDFEHGHPAAGFERVIDLFGDGTLRAASTPGHSPGHLSLIVRLARGPALLTGDAAYTLATVRGEEQPWRVAEPDAFHHSLLQLRRFARDNPEALLVPGHDMDAWRGLADAY